MMHALEPDVTHHAFLADLTRYQLEQVARCASPAIFAAGQVIFREGDEADRVYILTAGRVAVELSVPGGPTLGAAPPKAIPIQTLGAGDVLGWSWFSPPYRWHFDAHALELTRGVAFDAHSLRLYCERDHSLGFALTKQYAHSLLDRVLATRRQLLDLAGGS